MDGLFLESCESTNAVAREHGIQGAPHGFWVSARTQTSGRGRWGRQWASTPGNLFLSVILRPARSDHWTWIPMVSALAVAGLLKSRWPGLQLSVKWPNDLCIGDRKLAGVLCESFSTAGTAPFLVLGLGLNVSHAPEGPELLDQQAASLAQFVDLGSTPNSQVREAMLVSLRSEAALAIAQAVARLDREGADWVPPLFWGLARFAVGSEVSWQEGELCHRGRIRGLGAFGELQVECDGLVRSLYAEDIHAVRAV